MYDILALPRLHPRRLAHVPAKWTPVRIASSPRAGQYEAGARRRQFSLPPTRRLNRGSRRLLLAQSRHDYVLSNVRFWGKADIGSASEPSADITRSMGLRGRWNEGRLYPTWGMIEMTIAQADVVVSVESIASFPRKALAASTIGYAMDGFDLLILGFMLRAISADLHLTPPQAGSLVTWTLVGAVVGGVLFGVLSDYYGRVRVLTWTILLFAAFTGLCAFAQSYWDLLIYRTIAGLGLGGEFGIGMTLVAEAWPASHRARGCTYVALGWRPEFSLRR